ncbi:DsrE family protein [Halomonas dongshanensis]|uniref:DsrE family protein n=1 Tax=Halomonas dongshanensis TaxID=2890835 RepID=A0ABT2EJ19_9GAMM|nr:DsrE family protein [Halomonas dongshanensis]MCS2610582.1 DsrE family protein [Halomonas dongshanensis]
MTDSVLIIIRHAPHDGNRLREALDVALVGAAFGKSVRLLFLGQGVVALLKGQGPGAPGQKATLPIIDMLDMYDIESLLVVDEELSQLGLSQDQLAAHVEVVAKAHVPSIVRSTASVFTF